MGGRLDQSRAPVLEALDAYRRRGYIPVTPPGHKQGRGADPRVLAMLVPAVFASDVPAVAGLDRMSSGRILERAEQLMAEAVAAGRALLSTCGSSLSVKSAMLAVARPHQELVISRDAHTRRRPGRAPVEAGARVSAQRRGRGHGRAGRGRSVDAFKSARSAPAISLMTWWAPSSFPVTSTPATRLFATGRPSLSGSDIIAPMRPGRAGRWTMGAPPGSGKP